MALATCSSLRMKLTGPCVQIRFVICAPSDVSAAPPGLMCAMVVNSVLSGSSLHGRITFPARSTSVRTKSFPAPDGESTSSDLLMITYVPGTRRVQLVRKEG